MLSAPKPISAIEPAATPAITAIRASTTCQPIPTQASNRARRSSRARSAGVRAGPHERERERTSAADLEQRRRLLRHASPDSARVRRRRARGPLSVSEYITIFPSRRERTRPCERSVRTWWETRFCERSTIQARSQTQNSSASAERRQGSAGSDRRGLARGRPQTRQRSSRDAHAGFAPLFRDRDRADRNDRQPLGHTNVCCCVLISALDDSSTRRRPLRRPHPCSR